MPRIVENILIKIDSSTPTGPVIVVAGRKNCVTVVTVLRLVFEVSPLGISARRYSISVTLNSENGSSIPLSDLVVVPSAVSNRLTGPTVQYAASKSLSLAPSEILTISVSPTLESTDQITVTGLASVEALMEVVR